MHPPSSKDNGEIVEATGLSEIAICIKRKLLFSLNLLLLKIEVMCREMADIFSSNRSAICG